MGHKGRQPRPRHTPAHTHLAIPIDILKKQACHLGYGEDNGVGHEVGREASSVLEPNDSVQIEVVVGCNDAAIMAGPKHSNIMSYVRHSRREKSGAFTWVRVNARASGGVSADGVTPTHPSVNRRLEQLQSRSTRQAPAR